MTPTQRILVIDDDSDLGEFISAAAEKMGLTCDFTTSPARFLELLAEERDAATLVLLDLIMPEMDGIELLRLLSQRRTNAKIVLMSGIGKRVLKTAHSLARALGLNIVGQMQKPFRLAELEAVLRGHVESYTPNIPAPAAAEPRLGPVVSDEEIEGAVRRNEFILHYQPQIKLAGNTAVGVEALVRWQHPRLGLVFPDTFIPRIEQLGLIDHLGWLVAARAFAELPLFAAPDGSLPQLSINASVNSLRDLEFPDTLAALADTHSIPIAKVTIEITESGLISELASTLDVLIRLRMKGVLLSIDDFGTGYSMMQQLLNVPATELKIDRSFVMKMGDSESNSIMVLKTIEIGHALGMQVVAEGVETDEQLDLLRAQGCDLVQGYLFSRPLAPQQMTAWLQGFRDTTT